MIDPERWREVDRVFAGALELPPDERPAFLDETCAGDPGLRREVERLLAADERISSFLEHPAGQVLGLALDSREEGGRLGPYRLLRRIGGGGMGAVYLARRDDEEYHREVAVKILRSGLAGTEASHRFLAERQILARLEHPNIARLYDGGSTEDGRPFLVMELVEGLPVDEYCDGHQLTVDQRLDLFRRICAAVQHAHQNLLVHRDLKPANILVTPGGEPKLLDFGIAKQLEPAAAGAGSLTRTGLRMMTPSYASPEQVKGEAITTASDVYSLGVILYELLAGRSPYQERGELPYEIERAICEGEPERPSAALFRPGEPPSAEEIARARRSHPQALRRRLQGDLDNIVRMALRKEPGRRYDSAAQLSQDLERHLHSFPVAARPDTLGYRTRKLLRRRRGAVAAAAVVALLVAGFVASLIAQGWRLAQERDKARYALSFLVETFQQADPYQTRGERLTAREILDEGADRISRELAGQPDVQAAVMDAIGEVNRGLGRYAEAEPLLERALELRRRAHGPESPEVSESLEHLGRLRFDRSDLQGAEELLRQSLVLRRKLPDGGGLDTARTLNFLGDVLVAKGEPSEVEGLHREALAIARRVEGPVGPTVAESMLALAQLERSRGNYTESEKLFREGLAVEQKALGDRDPQLYRFRTELAQILIETGRFREAEVLLRETLKIQTSVFGRKHPAVASTLTDLGVAVHRQARYAEAEAIHRESLALTRSLFGPSNLQVGVVLGNLAASMEGLKKSAEAIPVYTEALEIRRRNLGEQHPLVAQAILLLAGAHRELRHYPEALRLAHQALAILEKAEGPDHPHVAYALREIGRCHLNLRQLTKAEPYLRRALDIRRKELADDHPDVARAKASLGACLLLLGRGTEAEPLLRDAYAVLSARYGPDNQQVRTLREQLETIRQSRPTPAPGAGS